MTPEDNPRDQTQFDREEYEASEKAAEQENNITKKAAQCGHNDIMKQFPNPEPELIIPDVITAKHWLPSTEADFFSDGGVDPRATLHGYLKKMTIEPAVVMDPEKPDRVKVISSWWIHADCHGIMTPEIFALDLTAGLSGLAKTIREDQDPFQPVRIYKEANNAYGVGFFDFIGERFPFDLRVVIQFGTWQFTADNGEPVNSSGFKFSIATLVLPTEADHDIYVGKDWGKMFDDPDCMEKAKTRFPKSDLESGFLKSEF